MENSLFFSLLAGNSPPVRPVSQDCVRHQAVGPSRPNFAEPKLARHFRGLCRLRALPLRIEPDAGGVSHISFETQTDTASPLPMSGWTSPWPEQPSRRSRHDRREYDRARSERCRATYAWASG
jgi:hypothetical protein